MDRDRLFHESEGEWTKGSFEFDARVVNVFDDMVSRSVPGYATIQLLISDLAIQHCKNGAIYDLGCSTGNTIMALLERATTPIKIIGVDDSIEMVEKCKNKLKGHVKEAEVTVKKLNIESDDVFKDGLADVVILNLVLQFIRPLKRLNILKELHSKTNKEGCLIIVEKTINTDKYINSLFIDYYYRYKKEMGYSDIEISKKRTSLENILVPFTVEENIAMFKEAGYSEVSSFFQWMNFSGFIAIK